VTNTPHAAPAGGRPLGRWAAAGVGVLALLLAACAPTEDAHDAAHDVDATEEPDADRDDATSSSTFPSDRAPGAASTDDEPGDGTAGDDGDAADDAALGDGEDRGRLGAAATPPARVTIEAVGVDAEVIPLDLRDDGTIEVPPDHADVGWYRSGAAPGEAGPTVLGAHVDWDGRPGVFRDLDRLTSGDRIEVADADGTTTVYEVTHLEQHRKDAFPTFEVYGGTPDDELRLVTCGGPFLAEQRSHRDNIVAFATAVA